MGGRQPKSILKKRSMFDPVPPPVSVPPRPTLSGTSGNRKTGSNSGLNTNPAPPQRTSAAVSKTNRPYGPPPARESASSSSKATANSQAPRPPVSRNSTVKTNTGKSAPTVAANNASTANTGKPDPGAAANSASTTNNAKRASGVDGKLAMAKPGQEPSDTLASQTNTKAKPVASGVNAPGLLGTSNTKANPGPESCSSTSTQSNAIPAPGDSHSGLPTIPETNAGNQASAASLPLDLEELKNYIDLENDVLQIIGQANGGTSFKFGNLIINLVNEDQCSECNANKQCQAHLSKVPEGATKIPGICSPGTSPEAVSVLETLKSGPGGSSTGIGAESDISSPEYQLWSPPQEFLAAKAAAARASKLTYDDISSPDNLQMGMGAAQLTNPIVKPGEPSTESDTDDSADSIETVMTARNKANGGDKIIRQRRAQQRRKKMKEAKKMNKK